MAIETKAAPQIDRWRDWVAIAVMVSSAPSLALIFTATGPVLRVIANHFASDGRPAFVIPGLGLSVDGPLFAQMLGVLPSVGLCVGGIGVLPQVAERQRRVRRARRERLQRPVEPRRQRCIVAHAGAQAIAVRADATDRDDDDPRRERQHERDDRNHASNTDPRRAQIAGEQQPGAPPRPGNNGAGNAISGMPRPPNIIITGTGPFESAGTTSVI